MPAHKKAGLAMPCSPVGQARSLLGAQLAESFQRRECSMAYFFWACESADPAADLAAALVRPLRKTLEAVVAAFE